MARPDVLLLRAPGTNCDRETAFAFEQAGARAELIHINRLLAEPDLCARFQIFCIPGGFSYGDDVAAGRILANQLRHHLAEQLARFQDEGKLILGICNGFQVLIKSGVLLPPDAEKGPPGTLTYNDSGRFEDRWVQLSVHGRKCVFLEGIESLYLPVAHAEGKFVARDLETLARLDAAGQLVLRYERQQRGQRMAATSAAGSRGARSGVAHAGSTPGEHITNQPPHGSDWPAHSALSQPAISGAPQVPYPDNPNGSMADVAGVCDATGRVLGLMPHPERHIDPTHHPRWTRGEAGEVGDGMKVFLNAVAYFA